MIERKIEGDVPPKHHIALRDKHGGVRYEECLTRDGFESAYTIMYHAHRPQAVHISEPRHGWKLGHACHPEALLKRHFRTQRLGSTGMGSLDARAPLLFNDDIVMAITKPQGEDAVYFSNGDGDELHFIHHGSGTLRTIFGDLKYGPDDYVCIPRGVLHRWIPDTGEQHWFSLEMLGDMHIPKQFRTEAGQLRMDAPYCHRDFRAPMFTGPADEKIRDVLVKRSGHFHAVRYDHSPLDVVGWDGAVYPFVFPILKFQPRVSSVHLPPSWHGTFAARGAIICSFVPRPVDFHPDAIPCPYPHSSVHIDEVLYYVRGEFTSRKGIESGSISLHPAGIVHGPHPGNYEASIGAKATNELAVMVDCARPLYATGAAETIEDPLYSDSFL